MARVLDIRSSPPLVRYSDPSPTSMLVPASIESTTKVVANVCNWKACIAKRWSAEEQACRRSLLSSKKLHSDCLRSQSENHTASRRFVVMALLSMVQADSASSQSGGHRLRNVELVSMLTAEFMRSVADESSTVWTILAEILALLLDPQVEKQSGGQRVKPTTLLRGEATVSMKLPCGAARQHFSL